ncbi:relaxase/mobilization nuclease domain-containing protein [Myroides sp. 1354]|uniref:Relaxase n=1 Tax=Myroides odoratimimus TaxID=76832 RepID=A0AAI8C1A6_9FLAO|nr:MULTISPECIES: conjugal transfer protein MobB [Myroides]ALU24828.1 relaxase [Myroides odoratimimus]MDM1044730.1 relaxase/mobilization nuclease domain-containing protein [Myroides sp. R163-1]MDM1055443.1 relaxase/mobilization nuclease domain-containing protein [Myroides sp. 1354]MDM1068740.1 relaxase/mobilization nuclease domain-containing protein [Myroides sp. 1372]
MIAKIGRGANMMGALAYNQLKVEKENGQILATQRIMETPDGRYTVAQLHRSFEPYFMANKRTEKPVLHISLNPDPADKVSDAQFVKMAQEYMERLGYGEQPYIVFKHTDIERTHIHIVSTCVDRYGKKIPDNYEKLRSMEICRALEQKYNLVPATEKQRTGNEQVFRPVDYRAGDVKSQIASVVRHLPKYYGYASLGAYSALLSLFNITAEEVKGELHGQPKNGLVYFALNGQGEKASNPFKASLFGKQAGLDELQNQFATAKEKMKADPVRAVLKSTIEVAMHTATNEADFKKQLLEQGINTVVRRNDEGRIYGMTFIDHESRTVWNGSALGKNLSANVFNDRWNEQAIGQRQEAEKTSAQNQSSTTGNTVEKEETHSLFDFLNKEQPTDDLLIDGLGGLLPEAQGEDYEEQEFANRMKKKKKRKRLP